MSCVEIPGTDKLMCHHKFVALTIPGADETTGTKDAEGYNGNLSVLIGGILAGVVVVFIGIMLFVLIRRLVVYRIFLTYIVLIHSRMRIPV